MLDEFLNHEDELIRKIAEEVKNYIDLGMKPDEIKEITEDLFELTTIEDQVDSVERKIMIEQAINAIKIIIESIPK